jgi:hypothetical protein
MNLPSPRQSDRKADVRSGDLEIRRPQAYIIDTSGSGLPEEIVGIVTGNVWHRGNRSVSRTLTSPW